VPAGAGDVLVEDVVVDAPSLGVGFFRLEGGDVTLRDVVAEFHPPTNCGSAALWLPDQPGATLRVERSELIARSDSSQSCFALHAAAESSVVLEDSLLLAENAGTGLATALEVNGVDLEVVVRRSRVRATGTTPTAVGADNDSVVRLAASVLEGALDPGATGVLCGTRNIAPDFGLVGMTGCP